MQTWQFLYFLFNKYIKFKKLDVLKPDVLKPEVLWVYHINCSKTEKNVRQSNAYLRIFHRLCWLSLLIDAPHCEAPGSKCLPHLTRVAGLRVNHRETM